MSNERDEMADEIAGWPIGDGYYGTTISMDAAFEIADAMVTAGYRKPRTITTRAELDALPIGAVVKCGGTECTLVAVKDWESMHPRKDGTPLSEWSVAGYVNASDTGDIDLPAVVLWEPDA